MVFFITLKYKQMKGSEMIDTLYFIL
uniref:Uncharacterized protein n=1 Tax=Anguilla anguilla TaxID=7936 RepID=A0A0E9SMD7_ANGAN